MYDDDYMELLERLTPQDIRAMRALNERAQLNLANITNGANILNGLGPQTGAGYLLGQALGNIGFNAYNNYRQGRLEDKARESFKRWGVQTPNFVQPQNQQNLTGQSLGDWAQNNLMTFNRQNSQPNNNLQNQQNLNQTRNLFKNPANAEYFPANINTVGNFSNYNQFPKTSWQPNNNNPLLNGLGRW